MEMLLELMPIDVLAADDEIIEGSLFLPLSQILSHVLEMTEDLIVYATFRVAGIVPGKSVSAAAAGQRMEESFTFFEFVEVQIKKAGSMAIYKNQP
jgi:hypothetical protein